MGIPPFGLIFILGGLQPKKFFDFFSNKKKKKRFFLLVYFFPYFSGGGETPGLCSFVRGKIQKDASGLSAVKTLISLTLTEKDKRAHCRGKCKRGGQKARRK